jgi:hypothetical protein
MRIRGLLVLAAIFAAVLASTVMPAQATMRIAEDRGGQIGHYLQAFAMLRSSGEKVVVDGNCLSACTLLLGLIPKSRVCATSRARFGFHAAWMPDGDGRPVTSPMGTEALWNIYPSQVKRWINRHGGLSRKMIYMEARDMRGIVSECGEATRRANARSDRARSARRYAPRPVRYSGANAASERR